MAPWRQRLYEIIFEAETSAGRSFDVLLLWAIVLSILAVIMESVADFNNAYGDYLRIVEWTLTVLFSLEFIARTAVARKPLRYVFSFYGLVDLLALVPTYLSLYFTGAHSLLVIRGLRLLRIFRVLKLGRYVRESNTLMIALRNARPKITVFLGTVLVLVLLMGSVMYLIEGEENGYTSIPRGMYWAIVTMTTVGYGDITPQTTVGQALAAFVMLLGYAILAVPTGIVSVELANAANLPVNTINCSHCGKNDHMIEAKYCWHCGHNII